MISSQAGRHTGRDARWHYFVMLKEEKIDFACLKLLVFFDFFHFFSLSCSLSLSVSLAIVKTSLKSTGTPQSQREHFDDH